MKKVLAVATMLALVSSIAVPMVIYANDAVSVTIDGQPVAFTDQAPTIVGGRTLVPVAGVFQAIGFEVQWDGGTRQATITRDEDTVVITIDSNTFTTNGISHTLDVPAQIINGRTMLPIANVLRSVGYEVDWNSTTRTVVITTPTPVPTVPVIEALAVQQPATDEFLARFDLDEVRAVIGVNFTVDTEDHTGYNSQGQEFRWRFLNLQGQLNPNHFPQDDEWNVANTQTGDVILGLCVETGDTWIHIDVGYSDWTDDEGFRGYHLVELPISLESYSEFISRFDHDEVRNVLGVDFTVSLSEWTQGGYPWRRLFLDEPLDLNDFPGFDSFQNLSRAAGRSNGNAFGTTYGDVVIWLYGREAILHIDLGRSIDVAEGVVEGRGGFTRYHRAYGTVHLEVAAQEAADFLPYFDLDVIREILGVDFNVSIRQDQFNDITWRALDLQGNINIDDLTVYTHGNLMNTTTGDAVLVIRDMLPELWIDVGQSIAYLRVTAGVDGWTADHRAYAVFPLN